jgi:hypothetical protein
LVELLGGERERERRPTADEVMPPHVVLFRLSDFHSIGWFALVPQHCSEGSCKAVVFSVWWCLPPVPLSVLDHF